ncbi:MAG: TIGR02996 domain-containing protein [Gemmataceae bacterium]
MSRPVPAPLPVEPSLRGVPGVEGMLHAVAAEPGEPLHRLVLADLLEEHGQADRARFVRLQVLEERWPGAATEELRLVLKHHGEAFRGGLHRRYFFGGGLIEGVEVGGESAPVGDVIDAVGDRVDVRRLVIGPDALRRGLDGRAVASLVPTVTHLTTPFTHEGDLGHLFWSLNRSTHPHLTHLGFGREDVRPEALMGVARMPAFPAVESMDLGNATLDEGVLAALLGSQSQDRLTELTLSEASFPLAELCAPNRLTRLAMEACDLHHDGLIDFLKSEGARGLQRLDLGDNYVTDGVVSWLAGAGPTGLEYLNLRDNVFHDVGAVALAQSRRMASLKALSLKGNKIGGSAAREIVRSPRLAALELLDLSITECRAAVFALASDSPLTRLHTLRLGGNDIGDAGTIDLAEGVHLAGLRSLELYACGVGEAGALALAASPYLGGVTYLDLRYNPMGERGTAAVLDRWPAALV